MFHSLMIHYAEKCKDIIDADEDLDESAITQELVMEATKQMFVFATIWAFGGSLAESWKLEFMNECVKTALKKVLPNPPGMWWEFYPEVALDFTVVFTKWEAILPKFEYNPKASFFDLVVPTKDTVTYSKLMEYQVKCLYPVFFTGLTGAGKSLVCQQLLESLKSEQFQPVFI